MRLGGMHSLVSFVGTIGTLMAESGLAEVMSAVFGGVPKMLIGKKFPQNVRAMRMDAEEILRQVMQNTPVSCKEEFMKVLADLAGRCKTTKVLGRYANQASIHYDDVHQAEREKETGYSILKPSV